MKISNHDDLEALLWQPCLTYLLTRSASSFKVVKGLDQPVSLEPMTREIAFHQLCCGNAILELAVHSLTAYSLMSTAYYGRAVPLALRRFAAWLREEGTVTAIFARESQALDNVTIRYQSFALPKRAYGLRSICRKWVGTSQCIRDVELSSGFNANSWQAKHLHVGFWVLVD